MEEEEEEEEETKENPPSFSCTSQPSPLKKRLLLFQEGRKKKETEGRYPQECAYFNKEAFFKADILCFLRWIVALFFLDAI